VIKKRVELKLSTLNTLVFYKAMTNESRERPPYIISWEPSCRLYCTHYEKQRRLSTFHILCPTGHPKKTAVPP